VTHSFEANIAVEGELDEAVLKKVLASVGIAVMNVYGKQGKNNLKENVPRYNQAAQHGRWVILVDLNNDAECPPPFINSWLPARNQNLQLRIAVRTVEAWLLAERNEMARFLVVSKQRIPLYPENEDKPKRILINIARHSRSKAIRTDIVPKDGSTAIQGPGYTTRLIEFTMKYWNPERAASNAPSLKRSINSLLQWKVDTSALPSSADEREENIYSRS
jgi:hypothetical protein